MEYDSKKIRSSILTLTEFYSGVLALALYEAIRGVAETGNALSSLQFRFFLLAFCATLLPFYHGIMRYFDDNYISPSSQPKPWSFILDYLLLCALGGLLVWLGAVFGAKFDADYFIRIYGALLVIDILWGLVAHLLTHSFKQVRAWLGLNAIVVMVLCLMWSRSHPFQGRQITVFLFIAPFRSIGDYWLNWKEMYFPKAKVENLAKVEAQPTAAGTSQGGEGAGRQSVR